MGQVDFVNSFGLGGGLGGLGFDQFVGFCLDKLVHVDKIYAGGLYLEISTGVGEGRFGLEVGLVGECLDKHVVDFDPDHHDTRSVGVHGVYVGIGHLEHVSLPYFSP